MSSQYVGFPAKRGLYDPDQERESCGVGFVCNIKGRKSRSILEDANNMNCSMRHRGGLGFETTTGDGAGILTSIPDLLFRSVCKNQLNCNLPDLGHYGVGNIFLPQHRSERETCREIFCDAIRHCGLRILCWREVPIHPMTANIGGSARASMPQIEQAFVVAQESLDGDELERALYRARKIATRQIRNDESLSQRTLFYVCSLSTKVIVYKGMLTPTQLFPFYEDLQNPNYTSHLAMVHSRFSTNTFPSWDRAQPNRFMSHNGEINTLLGNKNWMNAREGQAKSDLFGENLQELFPIVEPDCSDSGTFDNVLEFLLMTGRTLQASVLMMIPEAWQQQERMPREKREFYEYFSCLMEPWDGPASIAFTDGNYIGAVLDRNGLRPSRYYITSDDRCVMASEVGVLDIPPDQIVEKGRLQPGKVFLIDFDKGRMIPDAEIKKLWAEEQPWGKWLKRQRIDLAELPVPQKVPQIDTSSLLQRMQALGYTTETMQFMLLPLVREQRDPLSSMGNDAALAVMSDRPRMLYDYFKQLFAQVTNPAIDSIREEVVMATECYVGPERNILEESEENAHRLRIAHPILSNEEYAAIASLNHRGWRTRVIDMTFESNSGSRGLRAELERMCREATEAIAQGYRMIALSDRRMSSTRAAVSALLAVGTVHHHLVRNHDRTRLGIVVETGEAREVHHHCLLVGYGADAINPYLAYEALWNARRNGYLDDAPHIQDDLDVVKAYKKGVEKGILKVMAKMGISTLQSYKGAQIFEAIGIATEVIDSAFVGTASRVEGVGFEVLATEMQRRHMLGYPTRETSRLPVLPNPGDIHWRVGGDRHMWDPESISDLQLAVRQDNFDSYQQFANHSNKNNTREANLRGLLDFNFGVNGPPVHLEDVEPEEEIVKRFATGAMSFGSISTEAHEALAIAMNRIGGKSNTGEGGEDSRRYKTQANGDSSRSAIKQVASGRFGVTIDYLTNADELQIKIVQGAKPGEGGELPGDKVDEFIAEIRNSTPGVGLISPPPHHDIYSIEDIAQLIHDLKNSNPSARISVKLGSEIGVGAVAAGVTKARSDHLVIAGDTGGTGASPLTSIKHAGVPWELGLAEAHQTLVTNNLRSRVVLQVDGQLKTGRDVVIATCLGAEEYGFSTAPLIAMGCIMMRKCHLNTCPVGIATQDEVLRKRFTGLPEHVINYFFMVARDVRETLAELGFKSINELVGRVDVLKEKLVSGHWKSQTLSLEKVLTPAVKPKKFLGSYRRHNQDHGIEHALDHKLIELAKPALEEGKRVRTNLPISNSNRVVGGILSHQVIRRVGPSMLPDDTIHFKFDGSAGQSFGAWLAKGITLEVEGDANDYVGKGLSGGRVIVYPPKNVIFKPEEQVIVGNVALYGATSGEAFFRGKAAERFCVRNSGASAVVEGVGDHGCEYMTGGRAVVLGETGRNFAAGMSGGIAYVWDPNSELEAKCNLDLVELESVSKPEDMNELKSLIERHESYTGSTVAEEILTNWSISLNNFVKVMPTDYKRILEQEAAREESLILSTAEVLTMGEVTGFLKHPREATPYRDSNGRLADFKEIYREHDMQRLHVQSSRCMDCGVPFCQSYAPIDHRISRGGCPIHNQIPEWNDLVYRGHWRDALDSLHATNNFPEFTGRVCPAPCEGSCVLGITSPPVTIKNIEMAIIDYGFSKGWVNPDPPSKRTGRKVAIVGSGPAGLSAAAQLNRVGHSVCVYEREDRIGGLLMYGIPNMKLDKTEVVDRRVNLLRQEGIEFRTNADVSGSDPGSISLRQLATESDAVLLATGSTVPNDLPRPGRELNGIHFAMEFLTANTKSLLDSELSDGNYIDARDKDVLVIGGGDTGTDCIGTALRHECKSLINFELFPTNPDERSEGNPWPEYPIIFRVDYGHEEASSKFGDDPRTFGISTTSFLDDGDGNVRGVATIDVTMKDGQITELPGTEREWRTDLVLLALGFRGPEHYVIEDVSVRLDKRSNYLAKKGDYQTHEDKIFAAGDCRRGQSLVVNAINEGREAAREIDRYLMGSTTLDG